MATEILSVEFQGAEAALATQRQIDEATVAANRMIEESARDAEQAEAAFNKWASAVERAHQVSNNHADSDRSAEIRKIQAQAKIENAPFDLKFVEQSDLAKDAVNGVGSALENASKHAVTAGARVANLFAPGIAQVAEMTNYLTGSGGLVSGLALVGVGVVGVTYAMDHWFDKEEKLEAKIRATTEAQNAQVEASVAAYEREAKLIDDTDQVVLAHNVLVKEERQKRLEADLAATHDAFMNTKVDSDERTEVLQKRTLLEAQIKDNARNLDKARDKQAQATEDAANKAKADDDQRAADQRQRLEDAQSEGRVARLQRFAALEDTDAQHKILVVQQVMNEQNRADNYIANVIKGNEGQIAQTRINNRQHEADAAIEAIRKEAAARAKAIEDEIDKSNQARRDARGKDQTSDIEAKNKQDYDNGQKLIEMQLQYEAAVRAGNKALEDRALQNEHLTLFERAQHMRAIAAVEDADHEAAAQREIDKLEVSVKLNQIDEDDANFQIAQIRQTTEEEKKQRHAAAEFTIAEEQRKQYEIGRTQVYMVAVAAAGEVYAASMMVVGAAVDVLTDKMRAMGDVNRENYKDFFEFSKDTPDIIAHQVQSILAGLAAQASSKAIFESAEEVKETALGFGSLAALDAPGAAMHFQSAATHAVAATIYGTIGGGALAGAAALGASRGNGGLFGLTNEERDAQKKKKDMEARRGGSVASGPTSSGVVSQGGPIVVQETKVYMAGAIDADNRKNLAGVVGTGQAAIRRDGFATRDMERNQLP